jgi:hypothetical protein
MLLVIVQGPFLRQMVEILFNSVFKNAVILQQIYHRRKQGISASQGFGALLAFVQIIGNMATKALEKDSI